MVSLTRKKVRRQAYWYLQECQRVDGRPRITWQKYLGTPDHLRALLENAEKGGGPIEVDVADFGAAPLLRLSREAGLVATIDRLVPKRDQGYSVGEHLLIAVLNRCLAPCSKQRIRPWFDRTLLPRLLGKKEGLSSQDYWNHMDHIDEATIEAIQFETARRVRSRFELATDFLYYDPTNFSTYIQDHEDRGNEIPERGMAKDHRGDLRLIGLALLASRDHGIPLLHRTCPGNESDCPLFAQEVPRIRRWVEALGQEPTDVSLIFDKGNLSKPNLDLLGAARFHYISSLRPSLNRDLLTLPLSKFRRCYGEGDRTTLTYRLEREVLGRKATVVVTYNTFLERHLRAKLEDILKMVEEKVTSFARSLEQSEKNPRSRAKSTVAGVKQRVRKLLGSNEKLFRWSVERHGRGPAVLTWQRDEVAIGRRAQGFGRTLLFTDRHDWDDETIVRAYREKAVIEEQFRRLKDTSYLSDTPEYHWTDSKIKVHQLICFLALQLMGLLQRQLSRTGQHVTIDELALELQRWQQVVLLYPGGRVEKRFRPMSPVQERLYRELSLEEFA